MKNLFLIIASYFLAANSLFAQDTVVAKGVDNQKAEKLYNEGIKLIDKKDYSNALMKFDAAIFEKPEFEKAYYNRGSVKYELKDYAGAIVDFNKTIEINPNYAYAYRNRSEAYYKMKDYDKAWVDVHKVEQLGYKADKEYLELLDKLKKASGRDK